MSDIETLNLDQVNEQIKLLQDHKNKLQSTPNRSDTIYQYFTVFTNSSHFSNPLAVAGHICIALKRPPKGSTGKQNYKAAFAFRSMQDNYSKSIGRKIATSRLNNERKDLTINFEFEKTSNDDWSTIFKTALDRALDSKHDGKKNNPNNASRQVHFAPDWLRELVKDDKAEFRIGSFS